MATGRSALRSCAPALRWPAPTSAAQHYAWAAGHAARAAGCNGPRYRDACASVAGAAALTLAGAIMGSAARGSRASVCAEENGAKEPNRLQPWEERWSTNQIGFHMSLVNPNLLKYLEELLPTKEAASSSAPIRVLLPLCGKTVDMTFLSRKGCSVVGVEGVKQAIDDYASEQGLMGRTVPVAVPPALESVNMKMHAVLIGAGDEEVTRQRPPPPVLLLEGDFLALDAEKAEAFGSFQAAFDRGSLVAIEPRDRQAYAKVLAGLLQPGGRVLLVTLEHDAFKDGRLGPPFEVTEADVRALFEDTFEVRHLHREDQLEKERRRGCTRFHEAAYLLTRRPAAAAS